MTTLCLFQRLYICSRCVLKLIWLLRLFTLHLRSSGRRFLICSRGATENSRSFTVKAVEEIRTFIGELSLIWLLLLTAGFYCLFVYLPPLFGFLWSSCEAYRNILNIVYIVFTCNDSAASQKFFTGEPITSDVTVRVPESERKKQMIFPPRGLKITNNKLFCLKAFQAAWKESVRVNLPTDERQHSCIYNQTFRQGHCREVTSSRECGRETENQQQKPNLQSVL